MAKWWGIISLFITVWVQAQPYGNEWINYDQTYYKFPVVQTGFHRITYSSLVNANIPVNSFSSANIQIFGREKEVPLLMYDGGDNVFGAGDYLLFYAEKNDGWLDSNLYRSPDQLGNPAYSLYNDTLYYFFTWNNSNNNQRIAVSVETNFADYTPSPYIGWKQVYEFHDQYFEGFAVAGVSSSLYNHGEGYVRFSATGPYNLDLNFNTAFRYTGIGAPLARFQGKSQSRNNPVILNPNDLNHRTRWRLVQYDSTLFDTAYYDISSIVYNGEINNSALVNGTTTFRFQNMGDQPPGNDQQSLGYAQLEYAREPNLSGFNAGKFKVFNQLGQNRIRLDLAGMTLSNPLFISLGSAPRLLNLVSNGSGLHQVLIPENTNASEQFVVFGSSNNFIDVGGFSPVTVTGKFTDFSTMIADSVLLMVYHGSLESAANNYATYRQSMDGGSFNVLKTEVTELYWQFGGGVPKHINGIRRWSKYLYDQANQKPSGLFLLGKGIREAPYNSFPFQSLGTRGSAQFYSQSLIPSFGQPSSDLAITASWEPNNWTPYIPTGRISVNTNQELQNYLNKVVAYENQQDFGSIYTTETKDWQKQVLHFGGGTDALQQNVFQSYLDQMESIIEDTLFAGNVTKLYKKNSDPFDPVLYNNITDRLSSGVSLINFFGHANPATNGFEINIEEPSNWNNQGKYPIVIANTCLNGNIFHRETATDRSTSENFVRSVNSGAIAFISTVFVGFSSTLSTYTRNLYRVMSQSKYGSSLGAQMTKNLEELELTQNDYLLESNALQMSLNGDPMIRLNWHSKPEIELREDRVTFLPRNIDLSTDSITVRIDLRNLGKSVTDTFTIEIKRNFPQTTIDSIYRFQVPGMNYQRIVDFKVPLQPNIGSGVNQFTILVDQPSAIPEVYDEVGNNQISKILFLNLAGIQPVIPRDFAVVPRDSVVLKASTIDPLASTQTYRFEIDTTDLFNSPFRKFALVTQPGGVKEVRPNQWKNANTQLNSPLLCSDSTVYFWRVALVDTALTWKNSSFQYISGKRGWGQDHFFQFKDNQFNQIQYVRSNREKLFTQSDTTFLECNAYGYNYNVLLHNWLLGGVQQEYGMCNFWNQIQVGVVDPATMTSWGTHYGAANTNHTFGNYNENGYCRPRVEYYFLFRQDDVNQLASFKNMVLNEVPDGHYLIIYFPWLGARYDIWNSIDSAGMYNTFHQLGFDGVLPTNTVAPAALFVQKGDPSTRIQEFGTLGNGNDHVYLKGPMVGPLNSGVETSDFIGPADRWNSFHWKLDPYQGQDTDTTYLEIDQYNWQKDLVATTVFPLPTTGEVLDLYNSIDAQQTPYIRLKAFYKDTVQSTPAQLDFWHVLYDDLPEAAIDGTNGYLWTGNVADTVEEGEAISFAIDVKNIYDLPMDSLLINYWVEDNQHIRHYISYARQDSLRVNQTLRDTISVPTIGLIGNNVFWMEVNPLYSANNQPDQPELYHFNNLLQIPFNVRGDRVNPLLDVTFDGRHILNGDIVNPTSEIVITLKDENPFQIMNQIEDTALFGIYLTGPDNVQKRIPFYENNQPVLQWIPANAQSKKFKIIYNGAFLKDGKYTLSVQGSDRSGNLSGDMDYRVTFEIIRESSITYMMNYPNPFSTSTRFVFTLTGSEVPDDMIIQIMTVSGRIVKEITEQEFGPIHIGRNISEYAWDGTDNFGDRLANGVYLYRVMLKMNGEDIKHRESGADSHFTEEFGKMYLMR